MTPENTVDAEKRLLSEKLRIGALSGDLQTVESLFRDGVQEGMGIDLLWQALSAGHVEIAQFLLSKGRTLQRIPDLSVLLGNPRPLESVRFALSSCNEHELRLLRADLFVKTGFIALLSAALDKVPDPHVFLNRRWDNSKSPLCCAIELKENGRGDPEMIDFLLKSGAVFNADALVEAAKTANDLSPHLPLVHDLNALSTTGSTALGVAAFWGNLRACEQLLEAGASPHAPNREGVAPFLMAHSHPPVMDLLMAHGADPLARNPAGDNILVHAWRNHISGEHFSALCETLLKTVKEAHLLFENKNNMGQTVVHELAKTQRPGFDFGRFMSGPGRGMVNARDNQGTTPLMLSCNDHTDSSCDTLIQAGAQIEAQDDQGFTALMQAVKMSSSKTVKTLMAHGADLQATCRMGKTALDHAIKSKATKVVMMLQAMGGTTAEDPRLLSFLEQGSGFSFDDSPLIIAMKTEDPEFFRMALQKWMPLPPENMKEVQKYAKGSPKRSEMRAILQSHCAQMAMDAIVQPNNSLHP
jgi:ankyrin repeat protein